jgi:tartrate dehydratase beta subunit/fumarate hydratase class I family protein
MTMILYGECFTARDSAQVRISELADLGCHLETLDAVALSDGDLTLWIGAIGPFAATATRKDASHLAVRFKEPLDGKIIHHFNCR